MKNSSFLWLLIANHQNLNEMKRIQSDEWKGGNQGILLVKQQIWFGSMQQYVCPLQKQNGILIDSASYDIGSI